MALIWPKAHNNQLITSYRARFDQSTGLRARVLLMIPIDFASNDNE